MKNKIAQLSIVTQNQDSKRKAEKLAAAVSKELDIASEPLIEKYDKFENSYKIFFRFALSGKQNFVEESVKKTNLLCSAWTIEHYCENDEHIDMNFTKTTLSRYAKPIFNAIYWAVWESWRSLE